MKQIIETDKLLVTQANALAKAAYKMTLQEKRLMLLLISMIRKEDKTFTTYQAPVLQLADFLEIDQKKIYKVIKQVCDKLLSRVVHIDTGNGGWTKHQWVSRARYIPKAESDTGEAMLELKVHEDLRPMLLELSKRFSSVPFKQIASLPSNHSIRIFELLFHESYGLTKDTVHFELEILKKSLGIEGKYSNFKDFRVNILEKAQRDLEKKTPMSFSFTLEKKGKKVIGLHFIVWKNREFIDDVDINIEVPKQLQVFELPYLPDDASEEQQSENQELVIKLAAMGYVGDGLALIARVGEQSVKDVIEFALEQQEKSENTGNKIVNLGGFINSLIKEEAWETFATQRKLKEESQKQVKDYSRKIEHSKKVDSLVEEITNNYSKVYEEYFEDYWQHLDKQHKELVREDIKANGNSGMLLLLKKEWREDRIFFTIERNKSLQRMGVLTIPEHLNSNMAYLQHKVDQDEINFEATIVKDALRKLKEKNEQHQKAKEDSG